MYSVLYIYKTSSNIFRPVSTRGSKRRMKVCIVIAVFATSIGRSIHYFTYSVTRVARVIDKCNHKDCESQLLEGEDPSSRISVQYGSMVHDVTVLIKYMSGSTTYFKEPFHAQVQRLRGQLYLQQQHKLLKSTESARPLMP